MSNPVIIGITGGTGSGKSTVAQSIYDSLIGKNIVVLEQDAYYKNQDHLTFDERIKTNYDHPCAFDNDLLIQQVKDLMIGNPINKPQYDFESHTRKKESIRIESQDIIILEGIMILENKELRDLMDIKIFVDTDADLRIIRRIVRDIEERGRSLNSVIDQYINTVKPAHESFIEPTKKYADIIIPEGGFNKVAIDVLVAKVKSIVQEKSAE